jgi:hypothetical protein
VSYSEGFSLSTPEIIDESIRITRHSLCEYRRMRDSGEIKDMSRDGQVLARTSELIGNARKAIAAIESCIPVPYGAEGLYEILASGFLVAPYLGACREEFAAAVQWDTKVVRGQTIVVDKEGYPIPAQDRIAIAVENARRRASGGKGGPYD